MRLNQKLLVPALAAIAFASIASFEGGRVVENGAEARRAVQSVGRFVSNAGQTLRRAADNAGHAINRAAHDVKKGVEKAAKDIKKGVDNVAKAVVKGVQGVAELAKKGVHAIGDAVKKGLMALKDLLGWVWQQMRDKLLKPVGDFFKNAIEKGKAALQKLIDKALAALQGVFMDSVIAPAMKFAFEKLLPGGNKALEKVKMIAERVLGSVSKIAGQAEAFADTMEAFASKNLAKYDAALSKFDGALNKWSNITLSDLATQLVGWAKEQIEQFVKGKTIDLLSKAYKIVEAPINAGKTAALSAISSIPYVGGLIAGAADVVITTGLGLLREKGFDFIGTKASELAGKAVDWLGGYIIKGAGALDAKIGPVVQPIFKMLKPLVEKALGMVNTVKSKWTTLRDKLKKARGVLANAQAAVK